MCYFCLEGSKGAGVHILVPPVVLYDLSTPHSFCTILISIAFLGSGGEIIRALSIAGKLTSQYLTIQ